MTKLTVGIVDYGVGNHASVRHALHTIGFRCRVTAEPGVLDGCDLVVLPGVGAFRPAMHSLRERGLDAYLVERSAADRPLLGICLGMQLLAQASLEDGLTTGLGLVPGEVRPLGAPHWHIGWNTLQVARDDALFAPSHGKTFYFNHSYAYHGPEAISIGRTHAGETFAAALRRGRVAGVQFHPEKSQAAGHELLRNLVEGLVRA